MGGGGRRTTPVGRPTLVRDRLCWTEAVILGGLATRLDVWPDRPLAEIRIYPTVIDSARDESEQFDRALKEVTSRIGPPHKISQTESSLAQGLTYPKASWSFEGITVQVAILEGMGAIYIPFFQMKILHRSKS